MRRDDPVRDDDGLTAAHHRQDLRPGANDETGPYNDVVTAVAELDAQALGVLRNGHGSPSDSGGSSARGQAASAAMVRLAVRSAAPSPLSTVISASA